MILGKRSANSWWILGSLPTRVVLEMGIEIMGRCSSRGDGGGWARMVLKGIPGREELETALEQSGRECPGFGVETG